MSKIDSMKEVILVKKLRAEDPIELPMDEAFFSNLHNKIMTSIDKTEIKPISKWTKTWIFLEQKTMAPRAKMKKVIKVGLNVAIFAAAVGLVNFVSELSTQVSSVKNDLNKKSILAEAQKNPTVWSELVVNYQDESDFYADILSQRGFTTIVELDKAIAQSL